MTEQQILDYIKERGFVYHERKKAVETPEEYEQRKREAIRWRDYKVKRLVQNYKEYEENYKLMSAFCKEDPLGTDHVQCLKEERRLYKIGIRLRQQLRLIGE